MEYPEVEQLLIAECGIRPQGFREVGDKNSNTNLIVFSEAENLFVKIYGSDTREGCKFEIDILGALSGGSQDLKTLTPASNQVHLINDKPTVIFREARGVQITKQQLTHQILGRIARGQAFIHDRLRDFAPSPRNRFMPNDLSFISELGLDTSDATIHEARETLSGYLTHLQLPQESMTIIHDDISMENILVDEDELTVVDFSDAHKSYRISDIANTIKELVIDNFGYDQDLFDLYIDEYMSVAENYELSELEHQALPYLYLRRALFLFAYYSQGTSIEKQMLATRQFGTIKTIMEAIGTK